MKEKQVEKALRVIAPVLSKLSAVLNSTNKEDFEIALVDYELVVNELFLKKKKDLDKYYML